MATLNEITAVILAGGLGTRLRTVVAERPKALAPINGRPFLAYMFDRLADAGIRHIVLCTGHMADLIEAEFGATYGSQKMEYSRETSPLGTAGALRAAKSFLSTNTTLVLNGDSVCDVDLRAFVAWHAEKKAAASMVLAEVPDASRFGGVEVDAEGRLLAYLEKSPLARGGLINSGIYAIESAVIDTIPEGRAVSIEREIFPQWIGRGLYGFRCNGRFIDIGTPESYAQAAEFFAQTKKGF